MTLRTVTVDGAAVQPSKIVCIGRNYAEHIAELGNTPASEMVVFIKPNSAISETLYSHAGEEALHYEAEIALLIRDNGYHAVAAGLDLTRRQLQSGLKAAGLPWERAKAFDGSALFSPFVRLNEIQASLSVQLDIDGRTVQHGVVRQMLYTPEKILAEVLGFLTLNDGDIVMTGTPSGVGAVVRGSVFQASIVDQDRKITSQSWTAQ